MKSAIRTIAAAAILGSPNAALAFAPSSSVNRAAAARPTTSSVAVRNMSPESLPDHHTVHAIESASNTLALFWKKVSPEDARGQFYFFFGAGTGAGGIGLGQVPKILAELGELRDLAGKGPTEGGPTLSGGPFLGELSRKDAERVISKIPTPEAIVARGKSQSYFATKGYVTRDDFMDALVEGAGCNPLASAAVFEALSKGSGSVVSPVDLEESVAAYKGADGLGVLGGDLTGATTTRLAAYFGLAFLLFIVFDLIVESGLNAFFPDL